ncbi:MAG: cation diffusion facilitator family transporter [Candidatus Pacebacteria bacterium]|nr:cation diffusion facilitator family transporter [Candidatus Paceibacterota bacterium]
MKSSKRALAQKSFLQFVFHNRVGKRIATYLAYLSPILLLCSLNFSCMFLEMIYGYISNSLGLITDSVHMFFDCSALVLSLLATYFSSFPANEKFNYGYGRVEVISGFTNCVFLVFVAFSIVLESCERLIRPQLIVADQLIVVSVIGLLVNIAGIFLLINPEDAEEPAAQETPQQRSEELQSLRQGEEVSLEVMSNAPTSASASAEKSHKRKAKKGSRNENLAGLFLHITSDALGSVGVIVSAVCIRYYGIVMSDPICSLGISVLIIASILSLLKSTVTTLTMRLSDRMDRKMDKVMTDVLSMESVADCKELKLWVYRRSEPVMTAKVEIDKGKSLSDVRAQLRLILESHSVEKYATEISIAEGQTATPTG